MSILFRKDYFIESDALMEAGEASFDAKRCLRQLGIPNEAVRRAGICMYEAEINMVLHANGGRASVIVTEDEIRLHLADEGPGIPNVELCMQEGVSTAAEAAHEAGFGAGMGLPNMKKYSDSLTIATAVGVGTEVTMSIRYTPQTRQEGAARAC